MQAATATRQSAPSATTARIRPHPVVTLHASQRSEARRRPGEQPLPPSTRDRLEASFSPVDAHGERDAGWTTRARIAERGREALTEPGTDEAPELEELPATVLALGSVPEPAAEPVDAGAAPTPTPLARGPPRRRLSPASVVQTKLRVSSPGDELERQADAVAARVARGGARPPQTTAAVGMPRERMVMPARGPPAASATATLPRSVAAVVTAPGGGTPLDPGLRAHIEPHLGVDLGHVRVRQGPDAAAAARDLHARAFTSGSTIFLAADSSPADLELIAHEAAHVVQQGTDALARVTLMRDEDDFLPDISVTDVIPDWILDGVRDAVRAIPGYTLLTYVVGRDPLTDQPVTVDVQELIETLLTYGPFGAAVGPVLQAIEVLGDLFRFVMDNLAAHDLTFDRIKRDVDAAWEELSVTNGIAGNVAIVSRYVDAFLRDVRAFVDSIVEQVLEMVRAVVAEVAEPLLQTPEIAPVWNLTKKVLHYDPLRGTDVEAPTAEIIADFLRLIGEEQRLAQMEERGTLQSTADWLDTQLVTFTSLITELGTLFSLAWAAIQPQNLPDLLTNLEDLARRAFAFVGRVAEFAATVIVKILELIKDALLGWLSEHAHSVPGFHLLTVILGRNPFTGEEVLRTAENLIKGFITLLPGGEATYEQLAESGVIAEAAGRIEGEMSRLGISLELITGIFLGIWDTVTLDDLLDPIGAFGRILDLFGEPLSRLVRFIVVVIEVVITLVLRLMNFPSDLLGSIIANAVQAIEDIKRDPVAFILNMLEAVKLGFTNFFDNILTYLVQGLQAWLFRGLGQLGITIPSDLSLGSILTLVLQVLGITAEALWTKLGEHIGPERVAMIREALDMLAGAWQFIKDVQEGGIGAVWRYVTDQLSGLWDTLLDAAKDWIVNTIIVRVTAKLLSLLDPTGIMAVVNSFIAFFNAVQSAIEYLRDILEIINSYVSTLAAVAAGNIVPGAQMLEQGLAAAIPVAIGFLANQVGLGNVPEKIVEIIGRLRELVDEALDWLIGQAVRLGQAALNALGLGRRPEEPPAPTEEGAIREPFDLAGQDHAIYAAAAGTLMVASNGPQPVSNLDRLRDLHNQYTGLAATAAAAERRRIIRAMIQIIRSDPSLLAQLSSEGLGDAPNLGDVAPHRREPPRFQPPGGTASYAALWELESEHVIPRSYVNALFSAFRLSDVTTSEYNTMHTVLIYKGAADVKTEGAGGDNTVYRTLTEAAGEIVSVALTSSERARAFDLAQNTVIRLFESYAANARSRTYEAILVEWAAPYESSTRGAIRGRPAGPPAARVDLAFRMQAQDANSMLSGRLT